jgi:hypothetical protein
MSDYGELCHELKNQKREARFKHGVPCPKCIELLPKANPTILLPGQRCKIHGYKDLRPKKY